MKTAEAQTSSGFVTGYEFKHDIASQEPTGGTNRLDPIPRLVCGKDVEQVLM